MDTTRIIPHSPDWYKLRQGTFTASEIYKLMTEPRSKKDLISQTAETYILEKVHERLTGMVKIGFNNYATEWGVEHEPLALKWYSKITGNEVKDPYLVYHKSIKNFSCTPDSFVNDNGLIEVKCPANGANHLKHFMIHSDEYFKENFKEYYWQCVSQMAITEMDFCDFTSFDPRINNDKGMYIYKLNRNLEAENALLLKVKEANELLDKYLISFQ